MPVNPTTLSAAIQANMLSKGMVGRNNISMSTAVGTAVGIYLLLPNRITCFLTGVAGPQGAIANTGITGLSAFLMNSYMIAKATTKGFIGRDMLRLFDAVSRGITQILYTSVVTGTVIGCAAGTGVGRFTNLISKELSQYILSQMFLRGLAGRNTIDIADIIAFGVTTHLLGTVTIPVAAVGAPFPVPPVGPVPVAGVPSTMTQII